MKILSAFIVILILTECWFLSSPTKIQLWQASDRTKSSVAVTPQILILRRNFEDILDEQGVATVPLGSRSRSEIVFCEEAEGMIRYPSDRFGFRNPDSTWDEKPKFALVGDSFAQGACVNEGEDIASHLRKAHGAVLNLGSLGNGPLANLGVTKEYLTENPPERLLWFYVANDFITDLPIEEQTPLLAAYRDPKFTQSLRYRQEAIDMLITDFLNEEARAEGQESQWLARLSLSRIQNALSRVVMSLLRLDSARQGRDMDYAHSEGLDYEAFTEILGLAKRTLSQTRIQLVIIPDAGMFSPEHETAATQHIERLQKEMTSAGVETIDLRGAFRGKDDALQYYALKPDASYGHFTPEGYRLISEYLLSQL